MENLLTLKNTISTQFSFPQKLLKVQTELYQHQQTVLPVEGQFIIADTTPNSIFVYQAYKPAIAHYAVAQQRFGGSHFSFNRMTWIKPNFMWMMYRSGWATKKDQERILRLELSRIGFEAILSQAIPSSYQPGFYTARTDWEADIQSSDVRLQWDPDHAPDGSKLNRRAIQLGIRGKTFLQLNNEMLLSVADITDFVTTQRENISQQNLLVPVERVVAFDLSPSIMQRVGLANEELLQ